MSQYFTGKGDDGTTGLLGEGRVSKADIRMEVLGALDEASAALGVARAVCKSESLAKVLLQIQRDLYEMMAEIAATPENAETFRRIDPTKVEWLEEKVDHFGKGVEMPREFIVPGDSLGDAALALARTVIRRAERRAVDLYGQFGFENSEILRYLNRVSSLTFILEIVERKPLVRRGPTLAKHDEEGGHGRNAA